MHTAIVPPMSFWHSCAWYNSPHMPLLSHHTTGTDSILLATLDPLSCNQHLTTPHNTPHNTRVTCPCIHPCDTSTLAQGMAGIGVTFFRDKPEAYGLLPDGDSKAGFTQLDNQPIALEMVPQEPNGEQLTLPPRSASNTDDRGLLVCDKDTSDTAPGATTVATRQSTGDEEEEEEDEVQGSMGGGSGGVSHRTRGTARRGRQTEFGEPDVAWTPREAFTSLAFWVYAMGTFSSALTATAL